MHLISDSTGETLNMVGRAAAAAFYKDYHPIEHIYALVRTPQQLERVFSEIERQPGIVLFTLADGTLRSQLEDGCRKFAIPYISILDPVISSLETYLNAKSRPHIGGQHALNDQYFRRIDALNYSLLHDDGQHPEDLESADVVLVGVSRSSKTPTSIYLAIRGFKTANVPLVPGIALPPQLFGLERPLVKTEERNCEESRRILLLGLCGGLLQGGLRGRGGPALPPASHGQEDDQSDRTEEEEGAGKPDHLHGGVECGERSQSQGEAGPEPEIGAGRILVEERVVGPERRRAVLGGYFAPDSDFRAPLIGSLGRADQT